MVPNSHCSGRGYHVRLWELGQPAGESVDEQVTARAASPAGLPEAFGAGATDSYDSVASWSIRGPSCWGESKPEVVAPGVGIRTSSNNGEYVSSTGSSYSSAHLAGLAAVRPYSFAWS